MFLQDALDVQTPKVVLIETLFANQVMVNYDMNGEIYYSRFIHNKEAQREFVNTALRKSPDNILAYLFPVVQFHDN